MVENWAITINGYRSCVLRNTNKKHRTKLLPSVDIFANFWLNISCEPISCMIHLQWLSISRRRSLNKAKTCRALNTQFRRITEGADCCSRNRGHRPNLGDVEHRWRPRRLRRPIRNRGRLAGCFDRGPDAPFCRPRTGRPRPVPPQSQTRPPRPATEILYDPATNSFLSDSLERRIDSVFGIDLTMTDLFQYPLENPGTRLDRIEIWLGSNLLLILIPTELFISKRVHIIQWTKEKQLDSWFFLVRVRLPSRQRPGLVGGVPLSDAEIRRRLVAALPRLRRHGRRQRPVADAADGRVWFFISFVDLIQKCWLHSWNPRSSFPLTGPLLSRCRSNWWDQLLFCFLMKTKQMHERLHLNEKREWDRIVTGWNRSLIGRKKG